MKQVLTESRSLSLHCDIGLGTSNYLTVKEQLTIMEDIRKVLDHQFLLTEQEIDIAASMDDERMAAYFAALQTLAELAGEWRADYTMHQPCAPVVPSIGHTTCTGSRVVVNLYGIDVDMEDYESTPATRVAWVCRWHGRLARLGYAPILCAGNIRMNVGRYTQRFDAAALAKEVQKANTAAEAEAEAAEAAAEAEGVLRPHSEPTRRHTF